MSDESVTRISTPFGDFGIQQDPTVLRQTKSLPAKPSAKPAPDPAPPQPEQPATAKVAAKPRPVPAVHQVQNEFLKIVRGEPKAEEAEPAEKEEAAPAPPAPITDDRIAEVASVAAGKVFEGIEARRAAAERKVEAPPAEVSDDELPERYRDDEPVYEALKRMDPKRYGDIVQRISKSDREEAAYIVAWKNANPGKEFDDSDESHNSFYDKIEVKIPEKDLAAAREKSVEIRAGRAAKAAISEERSKARESEVAASAEAAAAKRGGVETLRAIASALPEYDLLGKSQEEQAAIMQEMATDKAATAVINQIAPIAAERFRNVELLGSGRIKLDPNNPHHAAIVKAAGEAHKRISALPADKQVVGGRKYVPAAEYNKMTPEHREKAWTIGPDEISEVLREEFAANLTAGIENTRKLAREIAGLPPEDEGEKAGNQSRASGSSGTPSTLSSVSNVVSGRPASGGRGRSGTASTVDRFWKSVGGS